MRRLRSSRSACGMARVKGVMASLIRRLLCSISKGVMASFIWRLLCSTSIDRSLRYAGMDFFSVSVQLNLFLGVPVARCVAPFPRSGAFGRNDHELRDRIACEREVEAKLERVGEAGLVVVAGHLGEHGGAARMAQGLRDEHRHPVAGNS